MTRFLLTLFLIHELLVVTKEYFSFEAIIKIDVKDNNNDNNYPFITLLTTFKPQYLSFDYSFRQFEKFLNNSNERISTNSLRIDEYD